MHYEIFDYIQEMFKIQEGSIERGSKEYHEKRPSLAKRYTQRTDGDDIEAQIAQRRHSLLSLATLQAEFGSQLHHSLGG